MDTKTIEKFFNFYKKGISDIQAIEIKLLKCSYSFEKWSDALKSKSEMIRYIYDEGNKHMRDFLKPERRKTYAGHCGYDDNTCGFFYF